MARASTGRLPIAPFLCSLHMAGEGGLGRFGVEQPVPSIALYLAKRVVVVECALGLGCGWHVGPGMWCVWRVGALEGQHVLVQAANEAWPEAPAAGCLGETLARMGKCGGVLAVDEAVRLLCYQARWR